MTVSHHPSDFLLLSCTSGQLGYAETLIVRAHTHRCPQCTAMMRALAAEGGRLLENLTPVPMREDAHARAMAAIEISTPQSIETPASIDDDVRRLSPVLRDIPMGPWRFAGFGVHWRPLIIGSEGGSRAFLLKVKAGTNLPPHTHTGTELTTVLTGSFHEGSDIFSAGDFEEGTAKTEHRPMVGKDADCICIVAMNGQLRLSGAFGRLLQPLVRF
jgi:putative transcriptional regulator